MQVSVADRRAVMSLSTADPGFRDQLVRDPRAALKRATGKAAPDDVRVEVLEEEAHSWAFVLPSQGSIEAELPAPSNPRTTIENDAYAKLRSGPAVRAQIEADPKRFLKDELDCDLGDTGVTVRSERAGEIILVLPYANEAEELPDELLDLVAGGGDPNCQSGSIESPYKNRPASR